jgi:sensor histidine kinase YesM
MIKRRDIFEKTYTEPCYRAAIHLLFWLLLFGSYQYYNTISFNAVKETSAAWLMAFKNTVVLAATFYSLMYLIWPYLLKTRKWFFSVLFIFVWLFLIAILDAWSERLVFASCESCTQRMAAYSPEYYKFLKRPLINIVLARVISGGILYNLVFQLSFPIAIKLGRSYFRQTVQQLQLAQQNLQLEFNFLKSQVNPHFLFNTLNNIYSLVVAERKEQAAATIARLSGFMRYALYETGDEKILLQKEVQLLEDYVALEKLRLNETEVQFSFENDSTAYVIPPLLFMPALENAFKYTGDNKDSRIHVTINALNNVLHVSIENTVDPERASHAGGIGLQNLQKRVQHYYGNQASYNATLANDVYLFRLSCKLS